MSEDRSPEGLLPYVVHLADLGPPDRPESALSKLTDPSLGAVLGRLLSAMTDYSALARQIRHEVELALPGSRCDLFAAAEQADRGGFPPFGHVVDACPGSVRRVMLGMRHEGAETLAIKSGNTTVAHLVVHRPPPMGLSFRERDELRALAELVAPLLDVAFRYRAAVRDADTDGLTGLINRRAFYRALNDELVESERAVPTSILLFDIDRLKQVNDAHGHAAGDSLLRQFARVLEANVRRGDLVARYGGDEFAVLMPRTPAERAWSVGARIRRALGKRSLTLSLLRPADVSFGAATTPGDGTETAMLVEAADRRLYEAKARAVTSVKHGSVRP